MSIVIDANTLSLVFCPTPNDDFGPIKEWVVQGAGRIVVGGTKYKEELRRVSQALRFVNELNKNWQSLDCERSRCRQTRRRY